MAKLTELERAFAHIQFQLELTKQDLADTLAHAKRLHVNGASDVELANLSADISLLRDHTQWLEGVMDLCPDVE